MEPMRREATRTCGALSDASYRYLLDALGGELEAFSETLLPDERRMLDEDWPGWARAEQWNERTDWTTC